MGESHDYTSVTRERLGDSLTVEQRALTRLV